MHTWETTSRWNSPSIQLSFRTSVIFPSRHCIIIIMLIHSLPANLIPPSNLIPKLPPHLSCNRPCYFTTDELLRHCPDRFLWATTLCIPTPFQLLLFKCFIPCTASKPVSGSCSEMALVNMPELYKKIEQFPI